jgi:hypothetical protein
MISYAVTEQHIAMATAILIEFRHNNRVQATTYSVRSCLASASGSA